MSTSVLSYLISGEKYVEEEEEVRGRSRGSNRNRLLMIIKVCNTAKTNLICRLVRKPNEILNSNTADACRKRGKSRGE